MISQFFSNMIANSDDDDDVDSVINNVIPIFQAEQEATGDQFWSITFISNPSITHDYSQGEIFTHCYQQ